eukprot:TRINITY_DN42261_c0_g1_i1.p1 TRINITY_DN42261_c0_g1~~TRINITY_DN42261_c0_g1_i1.p1  ORF type:complete len:484 (-),score=71.79 TRINITY_DN42261_c0_g1_i1:9-1340(-)
MEEISRTTAHNTQYHQSEVADLKRAVAQANSEAQMAAVTNSNTSTHNQSLHSELDSALSEITAYQNRLSTMLADKSTVMSQLSSQKENNKELGSQINKLKSTIASQDSIVEARRSDHSAELQALRTEAINLRAELRAAELQTTSIQALQQQHVAILSQSQLKKDNSETNISAAVEIRSLRHQLDLEKSTNATQSRNIKDFENSLHESSLLIRKLESERNDLERKIRLDLPEKHANESRALLTKISDLESQLSIQLADNSQMKSELRTLSSRIDKLGQVSLNYESRAKKAEASCQVFEEKAHTASHNQAMVVETLRKLEKETSMTKSQAFSTQQQALEEVRNARTKIEELQTAKLLVEVKLKSSQEQIDELRAEVMRSRGASLVYPSHHQEIHQRPLPQSKFEPSDRPLTSSALRNSYLEGYEVSKEAIRAKIMDNADSVEKAY